MEKYLTVREEDLNILSQGFNFMTDKTQRLLAALIHVGAMCGPTYTEGEELLRFKAKILNYLNDELVKHVVELEAKNNN